LSLRAGLAPDANLARLGITASRKVGSAVVRNRAKRLIREAFRTTRELWPPELDLVVIVKRSLDDAKLDGVVAEFHAARAQIERKLAQLRAQGEIKKAPRA
jgi:ribonuclease P protein component